MNHQTPYQEPWGTPDLRMPNPQGPVPRGPEIPEDKGSVPLGVIGALLGALVGAVPWFLVSSFTGFYVGWLGFLVGWASAFGYRKLKGRKSFRLAIAAVVICSLLALVAAEYGSYLYMLCTDPDVQLIADLYGISVTRLAFEVLLSSEVFEDILPSLAVGLLIGGLGILSVGKYVRQYTDPEMAAEIDRRLQAQLAQGGRMTYNTLGNFQSTGLALPRRFTVGMGRGRKTAITVLAVIVFVLVAAMLVLGGALAADGDTQSLTVVLVLGVVLVAAMAFALIKMRQHIDVDGDYLLVKGQAIGAWDIAGVSMTQLNGAVKLYGRDNRVLAQFSGAMDNAPLMMQWLREHNIPLRG